MRHFNHVCHQLLLSHLLPFHSLIIPSRPQSVQPQYIVFSGRFTSARIAPWHPRLLHLMSISVISPSGCAVLWSIIIARKLAILRPETFMPVAILPFSSRKCVMLAMYIVCRICWGGTICIDLSREIKHYFFNTFERKQMLLLLKSITYKPLANSASRNSILVFSLDMP